ncbi:MAG: hypothetical protein AAFX06_00705 [Planctomycetota bacterium]
MNVAVTKRIGLLALAAMVLVGGRNVDAAERASSQIDSPTHRQIRVIDAQVDGKPTTLHSLISDSKGRLLVAVGGQSMYPAMIPGNDAKPKKQEGYILHLDGEGNELARWTFNMTPSAVTVTPDGTIFVGGSGKVAKLDNDGGVAKEIDSPHIGDRETFAKRTVEAQQRLMRSYMSEESLEPLRQMVEQLEEKPEDERSKIETAQLSALKTQLEQMEKMIGDLDEEEAEEEEEEFELDPMMEMQVQQAMSVTSIASSKEYVFICATDPSNGGYSVWRLDQDLNPESMKVVMSDLRGCCGQMDIQCCDEKLIVSENSSFQVGVYDLDGEMVTAFGGQDRTSKNGFGSCCNPMNTLALGDGTVLAAESSIGHIKHFDLEGNLIAYVGKARIGGGCKHCAMAYDPESNLYFMQSQDKNQICVLGSIEDHPITEAEKMIAARQTEFLKQYAGTWSKDGKAASGGSNSFFGLFSSSSSSDDDSMYPMTSWTINADGSAAINKGQYAGFMQDAKIELLPPQKGDSDNTFRISLAEAQVSYVDATLNVEGDTMNVDFGNGMEVALKKAGGAADKKAVAVAAMEVSSDGVEVALNDLSNGVVAKAKSCGESCEGKDCGTEGCQNSSASKVVTATTAVPVGTWMPESSSTVLTLKPKYEYKLLSTKELGEDGEARLNELGSDGWEYCEKLGKQLMFKRIKSLR